MLLSELQNICSLIKRTSSRTVKKQYLESLPEHVQLFLAGGYELNSIGALTLEKISEEPGADLSVYDFQDVLDTSSGLNSRLSKQDLFSSIALDPELKRFAIAATLQNLAMGLNIEAKTPILGIPFLPQLCKSKKFDPRDYIVEEKYDGVRVVAHRTESGVKLYSRNLKQINSEYVIAQILKLNPGTIVDGEIVGSESNNMQSLDRHSSTVRYVVFDCLMLEGQSIWQEPLISRRNQIPSILQRSRLIEVDDYDDLDSIVKELNIEGVVAKNPNGSYSVNKREWFKFKPVKELTAKVVGFTEGQGRRAGTLGSILVEADGIQSTNVGSGFTDDQLYIMHQRLLANITTYVDLTYQNLTVDKRMRFPVFQRIRDDLNVP